MSVALLAPMNPTKADLISDPLFKQGYADFWDGAEPVSDLSWMPHEQEAYERGRSFAAWLHRRGEGRIALVRGFLAHPRAECLLVRAMCFGCVT